jgi:hypothetical protein
MNSTMDRHKFKEGNYILVKVKLSRYMLWRHMGGEEV